MHVRYYIKMGNGEDLKRWLRSILISAIIFVIFSVYLFIRRGYYNLYIINKVFGSTSVILAGITLLVGSLSKKFSFFTRFMTIRRHLGLLALIFALLHIIVSLSQTKRFPFPSWFISEWIPIPFGILAILIWGYMTYISRNTKIKEMGVEIWKKNLSTGGQLAFLAVFLHVTTMKYQGWIKWIYGQVKQTSELANPGYPPASIFVFVAMVIVILYRVFVYFKYKKTS